MDLNLILLFVEIGVYVDPQCLSGGENFFFYPEIHFFFF